MSKNRTYYIVELNGKSHQTIKQWCDQATDAKKAWHKFVESVGAENYYCNSYFLLGVQLEEPDLKLWGRPTAAKLPKGFYKPKRVKGSQLYSDFHSLPAKPDGVNLANSLGVDCPIVGGNSMQLPSFETIDGKYILSLHESVKAPSDCTAMKMSEYWTMKEEHSNES